MEKILIIDGNSILNRAFYGIRPLTTKSGMPTNALYGFVKILKKHLDGVKPDYAACAFDVKGPTFRHEMSQEYKANRTGMPEDLALQLPYAHKLARAMGFTVVEKQGYEGDDVIGTLAKKAEAEGVHAYILTGDRDSLQLLSDRVSVILTKTGEDVLYDPDLFYKEKGITPEQYVDVKALMGDSSDNIAGVAGIGEKTALKLIAAAGTLEKLYADLPAAGAKGATLTKLEAGRDSAFLSQKLARICTDVPGIDGVDFCATVGADKGTLRALFTELEFTAMIGQFALTDVKPSEPTMMLDEVGTEEIIAPAPSAEVKTVTPAELAEKTAEHSVVGIALENGVVTVSVYADGNVLSASGSAADFADVFAHRVICHDAKRMYSILEPAGISANVEFDTMLAAYLLDPGEGSYPIGKVAAHFAPDLPAGDNEVALCAKLYPVLESNLADEGMTSLLHDVEIPLAAVLCRMERYGILLDADGLRAFADELADVEKKVAVGIYERVGYQFNLNSPKQLGEILFEKMGLPHGKKTQRGYSTSAEELKKIAHIDPIVEEILFYREISKLRSTYGEALASQADRESRVHTTFNQCGTATGRLSSVEPNMQNIPVRGGLGKELRRYFLAPEGRVLIDADYSQIELRLLAAISGDETMIGAFESGADIHASTAAQVFHLPPDKVTPELRSRAKAVNFGIVYGIGKFSLSQDLGISLREAGEYIAGYLATYPKVAQYLSATVENAKRDGYTETMLGRRRRIPELSSRNKNLVAFGERVAKNSPIQGSAADVIKIAMIRVDEALRREVPDAKLILQVHDELIVEASEADAKKVADIVRDCMENAVDCAVRMKADVSVGKTWLDAKD